MEIENIRNFTYLNITFSDNITLFMMPNGTGKTTTKELIKGAFIGYEYFHNKDFVKSFKPKKKNIEIGKFIFKISIDENKYAIELRLNFIENKVDFFYIDSINGRESERPRIFNIFTESFIDKFIFDGELAEAFLKKTTNYAEESILSLFHLDKLKNLREEIENIKNDIIDQNITEAKDQKGLSRYKNILKELEEQRKKLLIKRDNLNKRKQEIELLLLKLTSDKESIIDKNENIRKTIDIHREEEALFNNNISQKISEIKANSYYIHNLNENIWRDCKIIIDNLVNMKLPKSVSEQFFIDLADSSDLCICGRTLGLLEKAYIKNNFYQYLDENNISALNEIKSNALEHNYNSIIENYIEELNNYINKRDIVIDKRKRAEGLLDKESQEKKQLIDHDITKYNTELIKVKNEIEIIDSKEKYEVDKYNSDQNLQKNSNEIERIKKILFTVRNNKTLQDNAILLMDLCDKIKIRALIEIKKIIIDTTNNKLRLIIKNDDIQIEKIDNYIKIADSENVSAGQKLSVAYSFISALFSCSSYDLPFVIDSPAHNLDLDYRREVSKVIPKQFSQLILFMMSSERDAFLDNIEKSATGEIKYLTIFKKSLNDDIQIKEDRDTFITFQSEEDD